MASVSKSESDNACFEYGEAFHNHKRVLDADLRFKEHKERLCDAATRLRDAQQLVLNQWERLSKE